MEWRSRKAPKDRQFATCSECYIAIMRADCKTSRLRSTQARVSRRILRAAGPPLIVIPEQYQSRSFGDEWRRKPLNFGNMPNIAAV